MLLDAQNLFSDAQSVTTGSENGVTSTNVLDLGAITGGRNVGTGERLYIGVIIDTAMTSSGSDDVCAVDLITDDNAGMNSPTVVARLGTFPAVSAAGTKIIQALPQYDYERYIALRYTAISGPLTAGAFTAFLTHDPDLQHNYPKNYTIS